MPRLLLRILAFVEDTISLRVSTVKGQSAQKAGKYFQILLAVLLSLPFLCRRLVEFEIDVAGLLSALLLGRISRIERREKKAVFREKPRKGDPLLFLPMPKYWECKIFVQDAINAFFCNFPVALWKIEEYNAVNKHIEGVFFRFSILMLEDSMNAMTLQNNMIISIILIGAISAVKE